MVSRARDTMPELGRGFLVHHENSAKADETAL